MIRVLAIIVSFNFEKWMDSCIGSLLQSEYPVSVLVVDNNSSDHTVGNLQQKYPNVRIIANENNLGFGAANNLGMKIALEEGYDAVFLLNQDAWINPDTVGRLIDQMIAHPDFAILSPVHLNGKGTALDAGFAVYTSNYQKESETVAVEFINAALWLMPSSILKKVGGFSPLFYHYGEDKDYVNRVKYHGYRIGYTPNIYGYHDRENRILSEEAFFRAEKIYLLSEYANINYSIVRAFSLSVLASIKKALQSLFHGKVSSCYRYVCISFNLTGKTKEVLKTRSRNKRKHANI